jgi:hypothetical protein
MGTTHKPWCAVSPAREVILFHPLSIEAALMLIATRTLTLRGDRTVEIAIRLFSPKQHKEGDWFCQYEIDWPHGRYVSKGWGLDAIQALVLNLQKIGADIYFSEYHKSGKLVWNEPGCGYGFPVPKNARDMLVGDDAVFDG